MFESLYLVSRENFWRLCLQESHTTLATSSTQDGIVKKIKNIVKKYGNEFKLIKKLNQIENDGRYLSDVELEKRQDEFLMKAPENESILRRAIKEAAEEIRLNTPVIRNGKLFKKVNLVMNTQESEKTEEKESANPVRIQPKTPKLIKVKLR